MKINLVPRIVFILDSYFFLFLFCFEISCQDIIVIYIFFPLMCSIARFKAKNSNILIKLELINSNNLPSK